MNLLRGSRAVGSYAVAAWLAMNATACVAHFHSGRDVPGHTDLHRGAVTPRGRTEPQGDPGEISYIVEADITAGGVFDVSKPIDAPGRSGGTLGLELSPLWLVSEKSHRDTTIPDAFWEHPLRPVLGWELIRTDDANDQVRLGVGRLGLRFERGFAKDGLGAFSATAGAAYDWKGPAAGPEIGTCFEMHVIFGGLCGRVAHLFGRGTDIGIHYTLKGFLEIVSSR